MRRQRLSVSRLCTVLAQPKANWSCKSSLLQTRWDLRCCLKKPTCCRPSFSVTMRCFKKLQVGIKNTPASKKQNDKALFFPPSFPWAPAQGRRWKMLLLSLNVFSQSTPPPPPCQRRSGGVHLCCHGFPVLIPWTNCATRSDLIV